MWGSRTGVDFCKDIDRAFEVTTKWRKNVFKLPSGAETKHFLQCLTRLYTAFGDRSALECITFKAAAVIVPLLLQQCVGKPNYGENRRHLARRLELWEAGNIDELLREGKTIQDRLAKSAKSVSDSSLSKRFATMVFNNNLKGAVSLVTDKAKGRVLKLTTETRLDLTAKHPPAAPLFAEALMTGTMPPDVHPSLFACINGSLIKKCCLRTKGGAGVSQQEDSFWHKATTGFKEVSTSLCNALAAVTRRLATEYVDPTSVSALLANRGIAVDKCPGLRPIGVGEIVRRIIGKVIMTVTSVDVQQAVGCLQLCGGQAAGVEAAVHAMREFFENDDTDAFLLIDADNAFNRINRGVALWNIQFICPSMKVILINFYRSATRIFLQDGAEIFELLSCEGTTQGCPLAMAMYALALVPLVNQAKSVCKQVWFADDASGCDKLSNLLKWYRLLYTLGPSYGYFVNPAKCVLVVKPHQFEEAMDMFASTKIEIRSEGAKDAGTEVSTEGARHLGAAIGSNAFKNSFVRSKVNLWIDSIMMLSEIAQSEPHAAFAVFTHALQSRWTFIARAMPKLSSLFKPLEDAIRLHFLPAILRRPVNDLERKILSLPARFGGLGVFDPCCDCVCAHADSRMLTEPLVELVLNQQSDFVPGDLAGDVATIRAKLDLDREQYYKDQFKKLFDAAPSSMQACMNVAREKGASSWVTACPSHDHNTVLSKGDFIDAICIRYGWTLPNLPDVCVCGATFDVQHALDCMIGGYRTLQHNEVRDVIANVMKETGYKAVEVEPRLQPLSGEQFEYKSAICDEDARSDIKCTGFWRSMRTAFFDIKVVSPYAKSYVHLSHASLYRNAEKSKEREYSERIKNVEHADFNPLVFTTAGGMAPQSQLVVKRIAAALSEKRDLPKSVVTGWLRCRLSFALLRTTLLCVRGTRVRRFVDAESNIELSMSAARIEY